MVKITNNEFGKITKINNEFGALFEYRVELRVIVTCFYLSRDMANNATELESKNGDQAIVECCIFVHTIIVLQLDRGIVSCCRFSSLSDTMPRKLPYGVPFVPKLYKNALFINYKHTL